MYALSLAWNPREVNSLNITDLTSEEIREKRRTERQQFKLDRAKALAEAAAEKEAAEKCKGMINPHKSLRKLLGEGQKKTQKTQKVAVVLCPKLTKVLRPHQIEGVKASFNYSYCLLRFSNLHSFYTDARQA